jgi:anti-sigma regulatory factor (Ser/Thr protein kinase)
MTTATHTSLFYEEDREYAAEAGGFLREGLERGSRGLVVAPPRRVDMLRAELGGDADEVSFVEDTVGYAPQWNVYRVLLDFAAAAPGVRSCMVAQQDLSARVPAELLDYNRLEAAANLVFAEHDVDLLCPYDARSTPPALLDIASRTHGVVRADGIASHNARYDDPFDLLAALSTVVAAPSHATTLDCSGVADVARARQLVRARGAEAGLSDDVVHDVALAVSEVLTNALLHGAPPALLHVYAEGPTWVCHVHDGGRAPLDPLQGLLPPVGPSEHGYGLWLARQLCAAVDVGSDRSGTHVRLHTRVPTA